MSTDVANTVTHSLPGGKSPNEPPYLPSRSGSGSRAVNTVSDIYKLAADDEEWSRLDFQHHIIKTLLGANYLGPVPEVLRDDGNPKAILDLGCGSGAWAREMATEFPQVRVVGLDLAPDFNRPRPPNCTFEVGNINDGLNRFANTFSLVTGRFIYWGVKDYKGLIHQISGILRPKGMIHFVEWALEVYDSQKQVIDSKKNPEASGFGTYMYHCAIQGRARGGTMDADKHLELWMKEDPNFEDVHCEYAWVPIMPSFSPGTQDIAVFDCHMLRKSKEDEPNHELLNKIGTLTRENHKSFMESTRPLLEAGGMPASEIDALANAAIEEGIACRDHVYMRVTIVWARKKDV